MESHIDRIIKLIFATNRLLHEQKESQNEKTCSYLHVVTLSYVKKKRPLMKEVAIALGITPPSATSLVNTIARAQLVKRQADANDRRTVRIVITAKGEKYLERYKQKAAETLRQNLKRLTSEEQEQLTTILEKINEDTK